MRIRVAEPAEGHASGSHGEPEEVGHACDIAREPENHEIQVRLAPRRDVRVRHVEIVRGPRGDHARGLWGLHDQHLVLDLTDRRHVLVEARLVVGPDALLQRCKATGDRVQNALSAFAQVIGGCRVLRHAARCPVHEQIVE